MKINIEEIVTSKKWKNFMKYLYGWGASIVILGALFKILHLPGAGLMLMFGMGTETVIFFFSAFEPIHEELDWTLVYPELTGMTEEDEIKGYRSSRKQGLGPEEIQEIITGILSNMPAAGVAPAIAAQPSSNVAPVGMGGALVFTEKFNKMLESAEISPALFDKVSQGLNKLGDASSKIADLSNSTLAVKDFSEKISKASESVNNFSINYTQSGQALNESINVLSDNIQKTANVMSESGQNFLEGVNHSVKNLEGELTSAGQKVSGRITESVEQVASKLASSSDNLASSYVQLSEMMNANGKNITDGNNNYKEQLEKLNKNMSALNAAHELHLQETNLRLKEAEKVYAGVDGMIKKLNTTVAETEKFTGAVETLNKNIASLNTVYGNMLSAINAMSNGK
ncbi:MAG TPA: gliding motility protein GldL [Tenuifilaceae bacterium]|nr:gliding motility protein GldL [Tenuifilaceae bacterium]HPI46012.1 gliding motility protein GldL [Tenuifilaceae bacterium]HPN21332.1 gliding motility protein GldL [Tenuifilaceae bacterium]